MPPNLVIEHVTAVTMNGSREIIHDATIKINGERITAVSPGDQLLEDTEAAVYIDGTGKVALPGLINCHTHIAMSLQKGVTLMIPDGIYRVMWPVEKNLIPDDVYIGSLAGGAEALLAGATTVVDHYFHADQVARATTELGLRGVLGHTIMTQKGPFLGEIELEKGIDFVKERQGKDSLVIPWLAPHAPDTVSKDWLLKLRQTATDLNTGLHLHLAQSRQEQSYIEKTFGMSCTAYLADLEFLGPDVLAAHCIFIEDSDIDLLADSGAHAIYCPMGHSLHGKPARAWEMLQRGVSVVLATDCVTSNNVMDLTGELRIAGAAQKQLTGDSRAMPSSKILEMVTVDAANAIGMGDQLGRLGAGYLADLILLDFDGLSTAPNYSLLDNIVYCCNGRDVHTVVVNGEVVVQDHALVRMDEKTLAQEIESRGRTLISKAVEGDVELSRLMREGYQFEATES